MKKERTDISNRNYTIWPSLTLNNMEFMGNHYYADIGEAICSELIYPPSECIKYKEKAGSNLIVVEYNGIDWGFVIGFLSIMLIMMLLVLVVFRRMIKQNMRDGMDFQVNEAVTKYLALKDSERIKKEDESA